MMKFHFLNVGHGDCTIVELPSGRLMMVDINNSKSLGDKDIEGLAAQRNMTAAEFTRPGSYSALLAKSWEDYYKDKLVDPYDYYNQHFPGQSIFRHIQTHPDMDHMSGLHNFYWDKQVRLWNFWDIAHTKSKTEEDFPQGGKHAYVDWLVYELLRDGYRPHPDDPRNIIKDVTVMKKHRHATGNYWTDDKIQVLSPTPELVKDSNENEKWNNLSYVLRFEHAGRSVILAGDAEQEAWDSMNNDLDDTKLSCDILKAAHHGRLSGYHEDAVNTMSPDVVICSVGKKPATDAHQEYKGHGAEVFSTRSKGTITATIWDDGEVWVEDSDGNRLHTLPSLVQNSILSYVRP